MGENFWSKRLPPEETYLKLSHEDFERVERWLDFLEQSVIIEEEGSQELEEPYMFFYDSRERDEVFKYCAEIAEYLRTENIPNMVIVDRSSRPLYIGVREYLMANYPNEKMPGIYFMNPKGFKAQEDMTPLDIKEVIEDARWKEDAAERPHQVRNEPEIFAEFEQVYRNLLKDKDKPLLVFDTCLHTGNTLKPIDNMLKLQGFSDVRIGSVNPSDRGAAVSTDFFITTRRPEKGCYPFDRDRLIEKTFDHVYSRPTRDAVKKAAARKLREEIKRIMQEHLNSSTKR